MVHVEKEKGRGYWHLRQKNRCFWNHVNHNRTARTGTEGMQREISFCVENREGVIMPVVLSGSHSELLSDILVGVGTPTPLVSIY